MRSVKLFACVLSLNRYSLVRLLTSFGDSDGALGSWGAALLEPYSDKPETSGTMRIPDNVWKPLIKDFVQNVSGRLFCRYLTLMLPGPLQKGWQVVSAFSFPKSLRRLGLTVSQVQNVHTIGDKANRLAIEAMESALGGPGTNGTDKRLRLEHAQIMDLEDLQKAAELGGESAVFMKMKKVN